MEALCVVARLVEELVSPGLPSHGAGSKFRDPFLIDIAPDVLERLPHRDREVVATGRVACGDIEDRKSRVLEIAAQVCLDLIEDDAARAARKQTNRRGAHRVADELDRVALADQVVEPVAVAQALARRIFDRLGKRPLAPDLQQAAVAVVVLGRPGQDGDGFFLADERIEPLAHAVPVDEEDNARSEMAQIALEIGTIAGAVGPCGQEIGAGFEPVARARIRILPGYVEGGKKALEELEPRAVHVRVGECDG